MHLVLRCIVKLSEVFMRKTRIGFACQVYKSPRTNSKGRIVYEQRDECKVGTVRVCNVKDLEDKERKAKLFEKIKQNMLAMRKQLEYVSKLPERERFIRLSSDFFPLEDHPEYGHLYDSEIQEYVKNCLAVCGNVVKHFNIRITSHPSQYITICSDKPRVVRNSLATIYSHIRMFKQMGLTPEDGVCINIHTNGASWTLDESLVRPVLPWITFENDEKKAGFDKTLYMCQRYGVRMVLDVHHYYCEIGKYLPYDSDKWQKVLATWPSNQVPKIHLSQSRNVDAGFMEKCAHSDMITDHELITYVSQFLNDADIMVEAKHKNLASRKLAADLRINYEQSSSSYSASS